MSLKQMFLRLLPESNGLILSFERDFRDETSDEWKQQVLKDWFEKCWLSVWEKENIIYWIWQNFPLNPEQVSLIKEVYPDADVTHTEKQLSWEVDECTNTNLNAVDDIIFWYQNKG